MIHRPVRSIQDFLLSTYFADGLRITFGVLLPSLILAQFGMLKYGMSLSLGALCVSVVDTPGPIVHRRNAMLITTALITVLSILVGLTNRNPYFTGILLVICSFIFSMFFLYGNRAAAIGTAVLLIMVLSIDDVRPWQDVLIYSALILSGSVWYTILSYSFYRLRPYRLVQQTLSESIHEVSNFLRSKALFYHRNINYDQNYAELLQLQVLVHEKQDAVRELLFKTREIVTDSTPEGRFLLLVFVDMVDLYEQVMSTYYNYGQLHEQFDEVGILSRYELVINRIAAELDEIAFSLKTGGTPPPPTILIRQVDDLKEQILKLESNNKDGKYNTLGIIALKNIEVNIENILTRVRTINSYFNKKEKKNLKGDRGIEVERFITRQSVDIKQFFENLTFSSNTFRHSVRVAIVMLIGYVVSQLMNSSHSYWILLTILVISKPGFSLTKQRNYQRLIGTVVGAFIGMGLLIYVDDKHTLFLILIICMIGAYSFQRKNYVISVLFMTPYILVLYDFLGMGSLSIAKERIYDTIIGSGIALIGSYTLFPNWEHQNLKEAMTKMLTANLAYYDQVTQLYFNKETSLMNYKVARKEVYVTSANLASLFQRMFSEPKSKQRLMKEMHQFTALNHLLSSYIASLSLYYKEHHYTLSNPASLQPMVNNTVYLLNLSTDYLLKHMEEPSNVPLVKSINDDKNLLEADERLIIDQFDLIQKVAYDIFKLSEKIRL
jgi:uncharacterized membrane protein (TIGR01666 family)